MSNTLAHFDVDHQEEQAYLDHLVDHSWLRSVITKNNFDDKKFAPVVIAARQLFNNNFTFELSKPMSMCDKITVSAPVGTDINISPATMLRRFNISDSVAVNSLRASSITWGRS